ncbi:MAG: hypothetical protein QM711_14445 [Micropruina sp.]|uniref:hypothetical protein n=1 Tax=Micropruina sp. TaxID=2737536 RepID=UPI0039E425D8
MSPTDQDAALSLIADRAAELLLKVLGYQVSRKHSAASRVPGNSSAFRVETSADYAIGDVGRAAGVARSLAKRKGVGLCTPERLEDDPMGLLPDLIDLEAPLSELERVVEAVRLEQNAREQVGTRTPGNSRAASAAGVSSAIVPQHTRSSNQNHQQPHPPMPRYQLLIK